jgi:hypothetical protein
LKCQHKNCINEAKYNLNLCFTPYYIIISFAIPGTSAAIERVFSITNALWTDEKSRFLVETVKAVIVTKTDFEEHSCNDSYTLISNNPKLL